MNGAQLIAEERERQISEEGWTPEHDDAHALGEIAKAGAAYALASYGSIHAHDFWPWRDGFKQSGGPGLRDEGDIDARIRDLAKGGALLAAEIDRLQRLQVPA